MKKAVSLLLVMALALLMLSLPVCAQTYSDKAIIQLSKKNATVGDEVTVKIRQTSSYSMVSIEGELKYNNAVLQFVSGDSGNTANHGSTVKIVKDSAPTNSMGVTVKFKAIAAGSGSLSYSGTSFSDKDDGKAAAGTAVTVSEEKASTDNNLGSLKISKGTLTPAFKASRRNYTATVKYDVTNITISANAAAGDAKVAGVGTFDLDVGQNSRAVTVTAASGDKKTYTIKIKRLSEEETAELEGKDKEDEQLKFSDNGLERLIVSDINDMPEFEGYEKASFENNDVQAGYYKDKNAKYNLVWTTDEKGETGAFYNRESDDSYTKINYLQTDGRLYVVEPFESDINVSSQFVLSEQDVNGDTLECYRYNDEEYKDYCVLYCYLNGQSDYYRYDAVQNTVQSEPVFLSAPQEVSADYEEAEGNIIDRFNQLSNEAKALVLLICFAGLLVFVLIILLIVKAASGKREDFEDEDDYNVEETPEVENGAKAEPVLKEPKPVTEAPVAEAEQEIPEAPQEAEESYTEEIVYDDDSEDANIDTSEFIDMDDDF